MPQSITTQYIEIGSRVLFRLTNGKTFRITITDSEDAAPERGFIFCESPLGAALLGRAAGEIISYQVGTHLLEGSVIEVHRGA